MKPPPGHRWRPSRRVVARIVAALMPVLAISGCGLFPLGLPAAPETTPGPSADATAPTASPVPSGTASLETPSPSVASASPPTGLPSYPVPTERACALPADAPDSVAGADGPTLTVKRVAKAWRASEAGKSHRGEDRDAGARRDATREPRPGSRHSGRALGRVGHHGMVERHDVRPCRSGGRRRQAGHGPGDGPPPMQLPVRELVCGGPVERGSSRPVVQVTGMDGSGYPMTDTFVRYGNTVTHAWMTTRASDR